MMKNNIDQILKDKLGEMSSAPPAGMWSKIESGMAQAAGAEQAFDQAVKGKIAGMSQNPPPGLWAKISATVGGAQIPFYKTAFFRWVAAASVVVVSLFVWNMAQNDVNHNNIARKPADISNEKPVISTGKPDNNLHESVTLKQPAENNASVKIARKQPESNNAESTVKHGKSNDTEIVKTPVAIQKIIRKENTVAERITVNSFDEDVSTAAMNANTALMTEAPVKINTGVEAVAVKQVDDLKNKAVVAEVQPVVSEEAPVEVTETQTGNEPEKQIAETVENKEKAIDNKIEPVTNTIPRNPRNINKYGVGLTYSPTSVNTSVNTVSRHDINLSFVYQNFNFIADLGVGVGLSSEDAVYEMKYKRYEFVKMQFVTDSLSYKYDSASHSYVPVPYGHQEKVFDDVKYSYSAEAVTSYTYLNIPFNFGYQKDMKHFSVFAKLGINYSLIISKEVKGLLELDNQSTLTSIDYPVRTRYSNSISYLMSVGGEMKLTESFALSGELLGSYYQNPFYEGVDKRPYALGMRFGLTYYFN
jgi:hypothetical protein